MLAVSKVRSAGIDFRGKCYFAMRTTNIEMHLAYSRYRSATFKQTGPFANDQAENI